MLRRHGLRRGQDLRIAIGGFQHETNTFAPSKAPYEDFVRDGGWPGLRRGGEILDTMVARNLPIAGFIEQMKGARHQLVPTAWAACEPSAHVTEDAFERIAAMIVDPSQFAWTRLQRGLRLKPNGPVF